MQATSVTISTGSWGIEAAVLSKKIGIDLGTSTVLVYVKGEGVVVNEPSVMATDEKGARVLAVGRAASELVGRGRKTRTVRLVRDGDGLDYNVAGAMLQHLIGRIVGRQRIFRPDVMLSVAPLVTGVERRAVLAATIQAGAKTAYLIDKPMAAAIGARVPVASTDGIAVVNLGAGSTELAAIALGEMLAMESIAIGGEALDRAIETAILEQRSVRLMPGEAERLKVELGSATPPAADTALEVTAVDDDGRRTAFTVSSAEVHAAIREPLAAIAASLQRVLGQAPEGPRASIKRNGGVLTGGGAQLHGIAEFLALRSGIPMRVASDPQSCVAVGTGMALDNMQVIRRGQHYIS
jgi:rod shape-determining protein MreB